MKMLYSIQRNNLMPVNAQRFQPASLNFDNLLRGRNCHEYLQHWSDFRHTARDTAEKIPFYDFEFNGLPWPYTPMLFEAAMVDFSGNFIFNHRVKYEVINEEELEARAAGNPEFAEKMRLEALWNSTVGKDLPKKTLAELGVVVREQAAQGKIFLNWVSPENQMILRELHARTGEWRGPTHKTMIDDAVLLLPKPWLHIFIRRIFPGDSTHTLSNVWDSLHIGSNKPRPSTWHTSSTDALALRDIVVMLLEHKELNRRLDIEEKRWAEEMSEAETSEAEMSEAKMS